MKIISALYDNTIKPYREMSFRMVASLHKAGYGPEDWIIYALRKNPNTQENHKTGWYNPVFEEKLLLVKKAMAELNDDVFWVDVDCLVTGRLEEMAKDCDFATTLRRPEIRQSASAIFDAYTNTGIFYIKNSEAGRKMLDLWIESLKHSEFGDQEAMNRLIGEPQLKLAQHLNQRVTWLSLEEARVKLTQCSEWNNFYFDDTTEAAKIIHFKGVYDARLYLFWCEKILGAKDGI